MALDEAERAAMLKVTYTALLSLPCVVAAAMDTQPPAHGNQPELANMLAHECILRNYLLPKYAAASSRMSRSSVTRLSSAFNRLTSAESRLSTFAPIAAA